MCLCNLQNRPSWLGGRVGYRPSWPVTHITPQESRPRWLSWMRRPTGDQEVAGSTPAEVGNILS